MAGDIYGQVSLIVHMVPYLSIGLSVLAYKSFKWIKYCGLWIHNGCEGHIHSMLATIVWHGTSCFYVFIG